MCYTKFMCTSFLLEQLGFLCSCIVKRPVYDTEPRPSWGFYSKRQSLESNVMIYELENGEHTLVTEIAHHTLPYSSSFDDIVCVGKVTKFIGVKAEAYPHAIFF